MFSRKLIFRRLVSFLTCLSLLLLFLSPAVARPAEAIAVADDLVLALGLTMIAWTGVSFMTNKQAMQGVQAFLNSSAEGLAQITDLATNYVVDNSLALCDTVQSVFSNICSDIKDFFAVDSVDSLTGSFVPLSGISIISEDSFNCRDDVACSVLKFPLANLLNYNISYTGNTRPQVWTPSFDNGLVIYSFDGSKMASFGLSGYSLDSQSIIIYEDSSGYLCALYFISGRDSFFGSSRLTGYKVSKLSFGAESIPFKQSAEVDGTQIQEITFVPGGVWEPSPDDPDDDYDNQLKLPGLPLPDLSKLASNDPDGESDYAPEDVVQQVKDLLDEYYQNNGNGDSGSDTDTTNPDSSGSGTSNTDIANKYETDWKEVFPFCVPFDLIEFLGVLSAEPEAPVIKWRFYVPKIVDQEIEIDLSVFDEVAQIMRTMELLSFCIGLILLTRNIIRG